MKLGKTENISKFSSGAMKLSDIEFTLVVEKRQCSLNSLQLQITFLEDNKMSSFLTLFERAMKLVVFKNKILKKIDLTSNLQVFSD